MDKEQVQHSDLVKELGLGTQGTGKDSLSAS